MTTERQERSTDNEKCSRCRKPKDKEAPTKLCPECLEKSRRYYKEITDERKRERWAKWAAEREANKAAGLCARHGCKNKARPGYTLCTSCARKEEEYFATRYAQRRASNTCVGFSCDKPCEDGHVMCSACLAKHNESATTVYHKKKAAGLCVRCPLRSGVPAEPGYSMCRRHLDEETFRKWVARHPGQDPVIA